MSAESAIDPRAGVSRCECGAAKDPRRHRCRACHEQRLWGDNLERTATVLAQGLSVREAAEALGVGEPTIRKRVKRLREQGREIQRGPR